jgi:AcrR family transcriptional regulator
VDRRSPTVETKNPELSTVERLLDTAAGLFWEKGFAATSTREIAAAVGVQQASLYHHMTSKEDLLYRICVSSVRRFLVEVQAAVFPIRAPLDQVHALIRAHLVTLLRHQKRNATMLTELRSLSGRRREEVLTLRETYARFVRAAIEDAQAAGAIRADIPARYLALALLNLMNWTALWFRENRALSAEHLAEILIKIFTNGVAREAVQIALPAFEPLPKKPVQRARRLSHAATNGTLERLVEAAVALFSRKGYAATSTREVAALLGIQKASLYYHVQGKEDLLYVICKTSLERIRGDVERALQEVPGALERIHVLIRAHIKSMLRDAPEHTTTLAEMHALSPERFAQVLSLRDAYQDLVRSVLQDARDAGALRGDIDVKYLTLSLLGLLNRVLVWYDRSGPLSPSQLGELLAAVFLTGAAPTAGRDGIP